MPSPLHYMQFCHRDFLSSSTVAKMSVTAQGIYLRLLMFQFEDEYLMDDRDILMRLSMATQAEWKQFQPFLDIVFPICDDGHRRNPRLQFDRDRTVQKCSVLKANGKEGGRPRGSAKSKSKPNGFDEPHEKETKEKPNGFMDELDQETKKKAITDTDTDTEIKELSSESSKKEPGGDDSLFVDLPWWAEKFESRPDMLASILAKWASEVVWKTGNRAFPDDAIRRDLMLNVANWLLDFVPDIDSLNVQLAKAKEWAVRQPASKQTWVSPDMVLRDWLGKMEAGWRKIRFQRRMDAKSSAVGETDVPKKTAMELLQEQRAKEQAAKSANALGIDPNSILEAVS